MQLGEITEPKIDQSGPAPNGEFTYVDISTVDNSAKRIVEPKRLSAESAPSRAKQRLRSGDVLVSMTRPNLNAVALVPPELDGAVGSTGFHVLRASERVLPQWLYYGVQTRGFVVAMSALVQGALYPAVRPKDIRAFDLPVPALDEQRRIVAELEKQFSRLDEAVANLKRVKANLKRYKAAVLKAAVAGDLTPKTSTWQTVQLGTVAAVVDPQPSHRTPPVDPGGVPYVGLGDFREDETIDLQNARKVSPSVLEEHRARYRLKVGDFVFGKIGTIGQPARLPTPFEYALSANLVLIQPDESRISSGFAFVVMASPQVSAASEEAKSATTQAAFGIKRIRQLTVDLPSIIEQRAIVAEVDRRLSLLAATEHQVERGLHRARLTRASLLSKAFGVAR